MMQQLQSSLKSNNIKKESERERKKVNNPRNRSHKINSSIFSILRDVKDIAHRISQGSRIF